MGLKKDLYLTQRQAGYKKICACFVLRGGFEPFQPVITLTQTQAGTD
jgi:hypothetical protein